MPSKKLIFFCFLFMLINSVYAQENCNCRLTLEKLITKIETEYPGFEEKTSQNKQLYQNHKSILLKKSDALENSKCIPVLQEYISFFKDEHIFLQPLKKESTEKSDQNNSESPIPVKEEEIAIKMISDKILYLKISSFQYDNIIPFKQLIERHKKQIENCKGLIIDIRNNGGGTDDVYQPLLSYILTNPIRIMSVEFFSTQTLINGLRDYAIKNIKQDSLNQIRKIEEELKEYKENLGKFVLYGDKKVIIDTVKINKKTPAQVVILANNKVASAGENFLFSARQSKKVKIIGTPSMGALDYGSIREFKFGCDNYELFLPTYRSTRLPGYPIDNIGIQPDIFLDDSITDWIDFAVKYINE